MERKEELVGLKERFAKARNDTLYVENASDNPTLPTKMNHPQSETHKKTNTK